jgi:hypothetical protein
MRKLFKSWVVRVLALMFASSIAFAQDRVPFRQEELDQMLAPVALYPDSLLSQMLMASTYPLEVVQAARWSRSNRSLKGEQAVKAVEGMDWDPSVKSLVAFPEVLARMDERLDWTERLGEAFLAQQQDVMATIQDLRRRADAKGNLQSNERMRVVRESEHIVIEPPAQEVVYVPYYSPAVVYGPWWWPAYPPVYWAAPPAYYAYPAYGPAFFWGPAIGFTAGFFFGHFDWHHHHAVVHHHHGHGHHHAHHRDGFNRSDAVASRREAWRHDPAHRRGVPFRTAAARERFDQERTAADRRGAGNQDQARVARRADDNRTSELRQRRADERRGNSQAGGGHRQSLSDDGNRGQRAQPGSRNPETASRPDRAADARGTQADGRGGAQPDAKGGAPANTRQARPESRSVQPDRDTGRGGGGRTERAGPQGGDRRSDRAEPRTTARLRAGSDESRAGVRAEMQRRAQAPAASPAARPAVAERRAQPLHGNQLRAAPQPQRHAERAPAPRTHAPAPQPHRFAAEGARAPRATGPAPRVHSQPRGGGGGRDFSAGRGGGGRS